jgi:ribosomal protein S18 acetylase RimI-like enzyme
LRPDLLVEENDDLGSYVQGLMKEEERHNALRETAQQFEAAQAAEQTEPTVKPETKQLEWFDTIDVLKEGAKGLVRGATETLQAATTEAAENLSGTVLPAWPGNPLGAVNDAIDATQETFVGADASSVAGALTGTVGQFVGGAGPLKAVGAGQLLPKGVSFAAKAARAALGGTATGTLAFDPHEERLSNLIQRFPTFANPVTEFLAADPSDSKALGRLKNAIENAGTGVVLSGTVGVLAKGVRLAQSLRSKGVPEQVIEAANNAAVARAAVQDTRAAIGKGIELLPDTAPEKPPSFKPSIAELDATSISGMRIGLADVAAPGVAKEAPALPGGTDEYASYWVARDKDGKIEGVLRIQRPIENGDTHDISIHVNEGSRRTGVASKLVRAAHAAGEPLEEAIRHTDFTASGSGLAKKLYKELSGSTEDQLRAARNENEVLRAEAAGEATGPIKEGQLRTEQARARVEKAKDEKAQMLIDRDRELAAWELIKELPVYKNLDERTRAQLDAHVTGKEAILERVPTSALQIEEGTRAIRRVAADLERGYSGRALEEIQLGRPANDVIGEELGKVFNISKMDLTDYDLFKASSGRVDVVNEETVSVLDTLARYAKPVADKLSGADVRSLKETGELARRLLKKNPEEVLRNAGVIARATEQADAYMLAIEAFSIRAADEIVELSKRLDSLGEAATPELEAELAQAVLNTQTFLAVLKGTQKNVARATSARRLRVGFKPDRVRLDVVDQVLAETAGGREGLRRLAKRVIAAEGDRAAVLQAATTPTVGKRVQSAIREFYVNNILSGPVSQTVNMGGTSLMAIYDPVEKAIAFSAETGSPLAAAQELKVVYGSMVETSLLMVKSMAAALRAFSTRGAAAAAEPATAARALGFDPAMMPKRVWRALRTGQPQLTETAMHELSRGRNAITGEALVPTGGALEKALGDTFTSILRFTADWTGTFVRIPTRLMTTTDEFFTNLNYFTHLRRESFRLGWKKGLRGEELKNYMRDFVDNADAHTLALVRDNAMETAARNVFQAPLEGNMRAIQNALSQHGATALLVPFFRTPVNLFKHSWNRHPAKLVMEGLISKDVGAPRFFSAWRNGTLNEALRDPKVADYAARWFTASMFTVATAFAVQSGRITGRGPSDPDARRAWETNHQAYSVMVNGKWVNYGRLDPFGIILGTMADLLTNVAETNDPNHGETLGMAAVMSLAESFKSRNYLQGLTLAIDAFTDTDGDKWDVFGRKFLSGFVPAGGFLQHANATLDLGGLLNADPTMRDPREYDASGQIEHWKSLANALDMRMGLPEGGPMGAFFGSDGAVRQWSVFGPVSADYGIGSDFISPLKGRDPRTTPFAKALSRARVSPVITADLRAINDHQLNREETEAFGELMTTMKLKGLTLEEAGNALASSPQFEALPDYADDSAEFETKQKVLRRLIGEYRKTASRVLLLDPRHPERGQRYMDAKNAARSPDTLTQLIELSRKR